MTFDEFWNAVQSRKGWKDDDVLSAKVTHLKSLCKLTWDEAELSGLSKAAKASEVLEQFVSKL